MKLARDCLLLGRRLSDDELSRYRVLIEERTQGAESGMLLKTIFQIMAHMDKAIDEARAKEARELRAHGHAPV